MTVRDAWCLAEARAVEVFKVYLTEAGGISRARDILAIANAAGIACVIGTWGEGVALGRRRFCIWWQVPAILNTPTIQPMDWSMTIISPSRFASTKMLASPCRTNPALAWSRHPPRGRRAAPHCGPPLTHPEEGLHRGLTIRKTF